MLVRDSDLAEAWAAHGRRARHPRGLRRFQPRDLRHRRPRHRRQGARLSRRSRTGIATTSSTPPSRRRSSPASVLQRADAIARQIAEAIDIVGLLAVEMFVTEIGEVLVNELAPRPHNSGHWTIDACVTSQFEQFVRAVCGLPLGSVEHHSDAVMTNLLGDEVAGLARDPRRSRRQAASLRQARAAARPQDGPCHEADRRRRTERRYGCSLSLLVIPAKARGICTNRARFPLYPLPPCGGGLGWGVGSASADQDESLPHPLHC